MALADICGLDTCLKRNDTTSNALSEDMMLNQCTNIENNYQLAMPPFANVRLYEF